MLWLNMSEINKTIAIASDHAGFELKSSIIEFLNSEGYKVVDIGCNSLDSVDYPDYGFLLAEAIAEHKADFGVGICGTGIGISIALNRNSAVRAALCCDANMAKLSREHNDANVLVFGARLISKEVAIESLKFFLNTEFEGGRHVERVKKLGRCCANV